MATSEGADVDQPKRKVREQILADYEREDLAARRWFAKNRPDVELPEKWVLLSPPLELTHPEIGDLPRDEQVALHNRWVADSAGMFERIQIWLDGTSFGADEAD